MNHPQPSFMPLLGFLPDGILTAGEWNWGNIMGDRVWQVPQDQFVDVWNGSENLGDVSERLKEIAGGNVPGWAALQRSLDLRRKGGELKTLVRPAPLQRV